MNEVDLDRRIGERESAAYFGISHRFCRHPFYTPPHVTKIVTTSKPSPEIERERAGGGEREGERERKRKREKEKEKERSTAT
jgi:hypothetical protein